MSSDPTPSELAMLAAILAGTNAKAQDRLAEALALWKSAEAHLRPPVPEPEKIVPLESVLVLLMPKLRPSQRKKRFHDFMLDDPKFRYMVGAGGPVDDGELEGTFSRYFHALKTNGVAVSAADDWRQRFPDWDTARVSQAKAKGGKAKGKKALDRRVAEAERQRLKKSWGNDGRRVFVALEAADMEAEGTGRTPTRGSAE
jgi:hypothetical protein